MPMSTKCAQILYPAVTALLFIGSAPVLLGQGAYFFKELTLDASVKFQYPSGRRPVVHSFAKATLYDLQDNRIYNAQVILGHQVQDNTVRSVIFSAQITTEIGLANSTTGDMPGDYGDCYQAFMVAHSNQYNLHEQHSTPQQCIPQEPVVEVPRDNCPILLDLRQNGFHLSGSPGVSFDIDADGVPDQIAWTQADQDEAFLCWDRNQNGVIEDGRELFGYATPLLSGKPAKVGYRALAELDSLQAGGNGDGKVDASDVLFRSLCAWVDGNRDGISQPEEIHTLDDVGVRYLEYDYRPTRLVDDYGNRFRYVSQVGMRVPGGGIATWPTFDVIFASQ
jgi:hypothetical protein